MVKFFLTALGTAILRANPIGTSSVYSLVCIISRSHRQCYLSRFTHYVSPACRKRNTPRTNPPATPSMPQRIFAGYRLFQTRGNPTVLSPAQYIRAFEVFGIVGTRQSRLQLKLLLRIVSRIRFPNLDSRITNIPKPRNSLCSRVS